VDPLAVIVALALVVLGVYVVLAWRSPRQEAPALSHDGLRWRLWHAQALRPGSVVPMLAVMGVLGTSWLLVGGVMLSLVRRSGGHDSLLAWVRELEFEVLLVAPAAGVLTAVLVVPWLVRSAWTALEASPSHLRLRRPWPRRATTLAWSDVEGIRERGNTLVLTTRSGEVVLEAPRVEPEHLRQVAAWLRATRVAPAEPVAVPPLPTALRRLLDERR
jgi:hypothetical protein